VLVVVGGAQEYSVHSRRRAKADCKARRLGSWGVGWELAVWSWDDRLVATVRAQRRERERELAID
jgi:hypothetical protein